MAKRSLLSHIQRLVVDELGISDSGPSTLVGLTDVEYLRALEFWNTAYVTICNMYTDWRFLWNQHSANTVVGTASYAAPSGWARWDHETIKFDGDRLTVYEYEDIKDYYEFQTTNGTPNVAVIMPDGALKLDPPPDEIAALTADYYQFAARLTGNTDTPLIPEQHEDIITWLAMMYWGQFEEAPMMYESGKLRFDEALRVLVGSQLPSKYGVLTRADSGGDLVMVTE